MSRSIVYLLPIVDDCLHLIGFRNQTAVVTIQTIGPSHDHQPTAWQVRARVAQLAQKFSQFWQLRLNAKNSAKRYTWEAIIDRLLLPYLIEMNVDVPLSQLEEAKLKQIPRPFA
jgi:hypothetical protein